MKLKLENLLNGCTLTELAQSYFPLDQQQSAQRALQRWIARRPGLLDELRTAGYVDRGRQRLTPKMVQLIIYHLGEPPNLE